MTEMFKQLNPEEPQRRVILLYGASGTGKTTLAAMAPGRQLFLIADPGNPVQSILGARQIGLVLNNQPLPLVAKLETYQQVTEALQALQTSPPSIDYLVIDSVTYLQRLVMRNILQRIGREQPRFEEWGLCQERLRNLLRMISDFPWNIIYTATEDVIRDELTGRLLGGPNLPGKLATELPQCCNIVARLFVKSSFNDKMQKQINYFYQSAPDEMFIAKDVTNKLSKPEGLTKNFWKELS